MNPRNYWNVVYLFVALLAAAPATAGDDTWNFGFNASAGARYDSNTGLPDVDANSGEADSIAQLALGASLSYQPSRSPFALRFGYDYSGSSHQRFDLFNLDLHHVFAEAQYNSTIADAAITVDHYKGVLDGEGYVSITQLSPSVARLFGRHVYVRMAWVASTRDYESLPERDARSSGARVDTYLLLDNLDRYVALGMQFTDESTTAPEFEYAGYQATLSYAHTFELPRMRLKLKSSLRYEDRNYAYATPLIGDARRDQRWRAGLEASVPFSEHVSLHGTLEHTDNASNLDAAKLQKDVIGLELRLAF